MFNFQGSVRCVVTALILYHIHSSLSSTFWKYFLFSFYLIFFRLRCNFYIISHRFVFVKYFFKTFWSFLSSWFCLLRRNFYIISHLFDFVKYFFKLFWSFSHSSLSFGVSLADSFIILPLLFFIVKTFFDVLCFVRLFQLFLRFYMQLLQRRIKSIQYLHQI